MPRPIKKHRFNTRRRKHHGGGKKKVSKKGRTTKRKGGRRVKKLLTGKKQGGSNAGVPPSKDPESKPSLNYNIKIEEIIDKSKTAAKNNKTAAENDKAVSNVNGNKIHDVYQQYLVPIKNYRDNERFEKFAGLFWDFIKLEIINIKENEKEKTLRKFVEDCLFKWSWSNSACVYDNEVAKNKSLKDWRGFPLLNVLCVLNGDVLVDNSKNWVSDFGSEVVDNIPDDKKKINFDDDAEISIKDRTWAIYNNRRKEHRSVKDTDKVYTKVVDYKLDGVHSGNPDDRQWLNTINFDNKACAEYRLWIIFKACFEEYGKAEGKSPFSFRLRKKTILKELFGETTFARPPPTEAERRRERAARSRKLGEVLEAEAARDRKAAEEAARDRKAAAEAAREALNAEAARKREAAEE